MNDANVLHFHFQTVTELRNRHAKGETSAGINVRKGAISDILEENVIQPLLVSISAITLATETVRSILKIDDIVSIITIQYNSKKINPFFLRLILSTNSRCYKTGEIECLCYNSIFNLLNQII